MEMIELNTPLSEEEIEKLKVGDVVSLSGYIYCGRDAVLPKIVELSRRGETKAAGIELRGSVIFHTAVSLAGVGPTSSNKLEIENSIVPLSEAGVKIHLGKGAVSKPTIAGLKDNGSVYAVIPPVTALLESRTEERETIAFPELGMEAFYRIKVNGYQAIVAAADGKSIYDHE